MRLLLVSLVGCASSAPPPSQPAQEAAPSPPRRERAKKDLRIPEYVARLRDDMECQKVVLELEKSSPKVAWALLRTCVKQDKFRDLRLVLSSPWKERLSRHEEWDRYRLLAHLVAIRGADFETDLRVLEQAGFTLNTLAAPVPRRPVVFRARVISRKLEKDGRMMIRLAEIGRLTVDKTVTWQGQTYKYGSVEKRDATGREVTARVHRLPMRVSNQQEYVFLGMFESQAAISRGEIHLLDVYRRGVVLPGD